MSEGIGGFIERTRERVLGPRVVNFSNGLNIVAAINTTEPTITVQRKNDILIDLKSFAPEGTTVMLDPKGQWSANLGTIKDGPVLTMGKFKGVDAILDFLHECGHLQDPVSTGLALAADRRYAENFFHKDSNDHNPDRFKALRERNDFILRAERNAWAFALKKARMLEHQYGIDIFKQMGGVDGVLQYVNDFVTKYERIAMTELEYLGFEVYSRKQMEKLMVAMTNQ